MPLVLYNRPRPTRTPTPTPPPTPTATPTLNPDVCRRYEPNDTLATAWGPLANGQPIEAALCTGDPDDYYFADLASATTLVLNLTNLPASTDYDLALYNSAGSKLAESRNVGIASEHIARARSPRACISCRVYPYGSGTQQSALPADGFMGQRRRKGSRP